MDLDTLMGELKAAHLDTGEPISASQARRLACEARIIPAVLDGNSQVLDLGRTRRFHNPAQRLKAPSTTAAAPSKTATDPPPTSTTPPPGQTEEKPTPTASPSAPGTTTEPTTSATT